jgi:hypothetical protein
LILRLTNSFYTNPILVHWTLDIVTYRTLHIFWGFYLRMVMNLLSIIVLGWLRSQTLNIKLLVFMKILVLHLLQLIHLRHLILPLVVMLLLMLTINHPSLVLITLILSLISKYDILYMLNIWRRITWSCF